MSCCMFGGGVSLVSFHKTPQPSKRLSTRPSDQSALRGGVWPRRYTRWPPEETSQRGKPLGARASEGHGDGDSSHGETSQHLTSIETCHRGAGCGTHHGLPFIWSPNSTSIAWLPELHPTYALIHLHVGLVHLTVAARIPRYRLRVSTAVYF